MHRNQGILRVVLPLLACCIGWIAFGELAAQPAETDAKRFFKQGLSAESLTDRIRHFRQAVESDPDFQPARYQLGIALYQKGEFAEAIQFLSRLDTTAFEDTHLYLRNAYTFYATELNEHEEFDRALAFARKALELDPVYPPALRELGKSYCARQIWEPCLEALSESVTLDTNQELVWNQLGDLHLRENEYQKAIDAYERALALNSDLKDARFHLKIAKQRQTPELYLSKYADAIQRGDFDGGISILRQARELFPDNADIAEKLQVSIQARDYLAALEAIHKKDWERAFDLLRSIDPEYRDTALRLEEVRAELLLNTNDSLLSSTPPESLPRDEIDVADTTATFSGLTESRDDSMSEQTLASATVASPDTAKADYTERDTPQTIFADKQAVLSQSDLLPAKKTQTEGFSFPWMWGSLAGVMILAALLFLRVKKKNEKRAATASNLQPTNEFIQESLASVTPVKFDPVDTEQLLKNGEQESLLETQTLSGGTKKVQRIGRYFIEREIGKGAMGLVYKAWDPMLDRVVVIKQMAFDRHARAAEVKRLRDRLYREARAAGKLNHPNIVIIYDVEEDRNISYIVMEYIEGENLQSLLETHGTFSLERTLKIAIRICDAVSFAHEHDIVHRDIKPSNIMLSKGDRIKVADFGIAKLPQFGTLTQTGNIVGTPFYMSPEQIEGRILDGRSDIFSIGVLLYEMLTGTRPFAGENLPTIVYKIIHKVPPPPSLENEVLPTFLDEIVERALAKDPVDRYPTVKNLRQDLVKLQKEILTEE